LRDKDGGAILNNERIPMLQQPSKRLDFSPGLARHQNCRIRSHALPGCDCIQCATRYFIQNRDPAFGTCASEPR